MTAKQIAFVSASFLMAASFLAGCGSAPSSLPSGVAQVASLQDESDLEALRAYPIEKTLGIGPVYGDKLRKAGVTSTQKLQDATSTRRERQSLAEKSDIPYKRVLGWAQQAELMKISGIGPRQASLLAAVGVSSVKELARRVPENLAERVGVANTFAPKFVDRTPSLATIKKWVEAAGSMPSSISDDK